MKKKIKEETYFMTNITFQEQMELLFDMEEKFPYKYKEETKDTAKMVGHFATLQPK